MELNLLELFVLSALNESGNFKVAPTHLNFGIAGAILFELQLRKQIEIEDSTVLTYHSKQKMYHPILDRVIYLIDKHNKKETTGFWITEIAKKAETYRNNIINELIIKRYLRRVNGQLMWIAPGSKYLLFDPTPELDPEREVAAILSLEETPKIQDIMFLYLLKSTGLLKKGLLSKDELKKFRPNFQKVIRKAKLEANLAKNLEEIQHLITRCISSEEVDSNVIPSSL